MRNAEQGRSVGTIAQGVLCSVYVVLFAIVVSCAIFMVVQQLPVPVYLWFVVGMLAVSAVSTLCEYKERRQL